MHDLALSREYILDGLSTIFWSLMIVVTLNYVTLAMHANNKGEGRIMTLLALASSAVKNQPRWRMLILAPGVAGTPAFKHYVIPIAAIVARAPVFRDGAQRRQSGGVFHPADKPRDRARDAN